MLVTPWHPKKDRGVTGHYHPKRSRKDVMFKDVTELTRESKNGN